MKSGTSSAAASCQRRFFAGAFLAVDFFAGAFFAGAFFATGAFFAGAFFATGAFFAGAFLAGAFFATGAFLAGAFFAVAFFADRRDAPRTVMVPAAGAIRLTSPLSHATRSTVPTTSSTTPRRGPDFARTEILSPTST